MDDQERLKGLLERQSYMVVAVALKDGTPWAVPVRVKQRIQNTFEWDSKLDTVHSKAIERDPAMAITIFEKRNEDQTGLYAKGKGELVSVEGELGRYRFTVEQAWLNDETFTKREIELG